MLPEGAKRYGYSAIGVGLTQFAPAFQPDPSDTPMVAALKVIAQILPVILPVIMDGSEKVVKALVEAFAAYKTTVSQAQAAVDKVTQVAPPAQPKV